MAPPTMLGAVAIHSRDPLLRELRSSLIALCDEHPQLHVVINHFDAIRKGPRDRRKGRHEATGAQLHEHMNVTWVPGMKGLFWKRALVPEFMRAYDAVWLTDADVRPYMNKFDLNYIQTWLCSENATVVQPSVLAGTM